MEEKKNFTLQSSMRQLGARAAAATYPPPPRPWLFHAPPFLSCSPQSPHHTTSSPLPHFPLSLLHASRLCPCYSLRHGARAPAQPHSSNAGSVPLLWGQAGALLHAPGCNRDRVYWHRAKVRGWVEGKVGGQKFQVGKMKGGGELSFWGSRSCVEREQVGRGIGAT